MSCRNMLPRKSKEAVMDVWFVGLIVVLAALTWGVVVLCERLLGRP